MKLKDFHEMSTSEMKLVLGGTGSLESGSGIQGTDCSTECPDGTTISITNCIGTCTAKDGESVTCEGSSTGKKITKTCGY